MPFVANAIPSLVKRSKAARQRQEDFLDNWVDPERVAIRRVRAAQIAEAERLIKIEREEKAFHEPVRADHLIRDNRMHRSRLEFIEKCLRDAGAPADVFAPMPGCERYVIPDWLQPGEDAEIAAEMHAGAATEASDAAPEQVCTQDAVTVDEDDEPVRRGRGRPPRVVPAT